MKSRRKLYSGCFYCHGYWCRYRKGGYFSATYRLKANWDLPRSFIAKTADRHVVARFVEGLYAQDVEHRRLISDGIIAELKYEDPPKVGDRSTIIYLSPDRLREVMTGQCPLGIPEHFGIKLANGEGSKAMTIGQMAAALVSDDLSKQMAADKLAIGKAAIAEGCTFQWVTVGQCTMAEFIPWEEAQLSMRDQETPPEHFILTNRFLDSGAQEVVYSILRAGVQYFARYVVYEGRTALLETGPNPDGPWQTVQYDPQLCAVLGLLDLDKAAR